ncbi:hypothetical protein [Thiomonas sp. FB-Cd]|uniref:hypothetical protein n=1 Tax=Thiomonas sp. FB-Cd TaxID=1158292 RepID=UPI000AC7D4EE|nr:hypothetical protein [Thiomonas sp. FB-Cd]
MPHLSAVGISALPAQAVAPGQGRGGGQQSHVDHKRVGSFWLDFLDFRRRTITSGWRFKMLMLVVDDRVVYKIWSGQPDISEVQSTTNPLGPLQGFGESALGRF